MQLGSRKLPHEIAPDIRTDVWSSKPKASLVLESSMSSLLGEAERRVEVPRKPPPDVQPQSQALELMRPQSPAVLGVAREAQTSKFPLPLLHRQAYFEHGQPVVQRESCRPVPSLLTTYSRRDNRLVVDENVAITKLIERRHGFGGTHIEDAIQCVDGGKVPLENRMDNCRPMGVDDALKMLAPMRHLEEGFDVEIREDLDEHFVGEVHELAPGIGTRIRTGIGASADSGLIRGGFD